MTTWAGGQMPCPECTNMMPLKFKKPHVFGPTVFKKICESCEAEFLMKASRERGASKKVRIKHILQKEGLKGFGDE